MLLKKFLTRNGLTMRVTLPVLFALLLSNMATPALAQSDALLHFWLFDTGLPNNTPLETIDAAYSVVAGGRIEYHSALLGYPFEDGHPNWRKASMERRDRPTEINYQPAGNSNIPFADVNMRGLQVKQPFTGDGGENTLIFHLPTTGYQNVAFRFAAMDEGAADALVLDYAAAGEDWTTDGLAASTLALAPDYQLFTVDFAGIAAANDNPSFKVRIRFTGPDMAADSGDRVTFNNFSLHGTAMSGTNQPPEVVAPIDLQTLIEAGAPAVLDLNTIFQDPDGDPLTFAASSSNPALVSVEVDGHLLTVTPVQRGGAWIIVQADDGANAPVPLGFDALVYPQAYPLREAAFGFFSWDPNTPELVYPDHILFLQSNVDDPDLATPLLDPYYIPHDDYHADDEADIGFPYRLTGRTRLNGLGDDGIAWINTGRGRDLGGLLLALDTRDVNMVTIDWLGGTLLPNSRVYAIRLQYRVGQTGDFSDVLVNGLPIEYMRDETPGHAQHFGQVPLPADALDQPYVQLLWRYYHVEGDSGPRAQLRLDDIAISAEPNPVLTVEIQGPGGGTVVSNPPRINCGATCHGAFPPGAQVTLHASAAPQSVFEGWTGPCAGQGPTCTLTLDQDVTVQALFAASDDSYLFIPLVVVPPRSDLVINEFMSSNGETLADEDGDFSDWIELYNRGTTPFQLTGVGLSDDTERPFRWVFPHATLEPGEFLLVWASGKNRTRLDAPFHTNFSISAEGESLLLTHPTAGRLDGVGPVPVPRDISYGRRPDGGGDWYFFDQPTPGSANLGQASAEVLAPPIFSHTSGFYPTPFELTLFSPDPDVIILYTLDGSEPDPAKVGGATFAYKVAYPTFPGNAFGELLTGHYGTTVYAAPLPIVDRSPQPDRLTGIPTTPYTFRHYAPPAPVSKAMVVRARAIKPDALPSAIQTHTFFVTPFETPDAALPAWAEASSDSSPDANLSTARHSLPVIALSVPPASLFDYDDGIYVAGVDFDNWRRANPQGLTTDGTPANYHRDWEHAAHLEMFDAATRQTVLHQDIGVRIHGGWSRANPRKSLRLYARSRYGPDTFDYPVFGALPDRGFRRLILRNSGQDDLFTNLRDGFIQTLVSHLRFDTQAYQPAVVYINGEYWGVHNIRERYDQHYLARVYGVEPENVDLLTDRNTIREGDRIHYNQTLQYIEMNGLAADAHYQYIQTRIDIENFIDYQITNIYVDNTDWPGSNIDFWRLRTDAYAPTAPYGHDGRWRWLLYDTDWGFGWNNAEGYRHNTLAHATGARVSQFAVHAGQLPHPGAQTAEMRQTNPEWATFLLRSFLENETFRVAFINRFADLMNTTFLPARAVPLLYTLKHAIEPEMPMHIARWNRPLDMENWHAQIEIMADFARQRPAQQRAHIRDMFEIAQDIPITLDVADPAQGYIRINTIDITLQTPGVSEQPYPWTGAYFHGIPIVIEAIPHPGYVFAGWREYPQATDARLELVPETGLRITAIFSQ